MYIDARGDTKIKDLMANAHEWTEDMARWKNSRGLESAGQRSGELHTRSL